MSTTNSSENPPICFPTTDLENQPSSGLPKSKTSPQRFQRCLLENMRDGAIFVDAAERIKVWNAAVESLTGIGADQVDGEALTPSLLGLTAIDGSPISDHSSPVSNCLSTRTKQIHNYKIVGRSGREIKVEMTFVPVLANDQAKGAVILIHDTSIELDLQKQLSDLYEFSMLDPLTQVANRAEFERVTEQYIRACKTSNFQCSLIICDIDFFKQINDNYNHHVGDQALVAFASLLKQFVRAEDVVARYGGEEFVILCGNCDKESAVQRAEEIRHTLTQTPQPMLDGKCITASFGVSQLQDGDAATDFFVRADTALLKAKELGRNRVVEADISDVDQTSVMKTAAQTSLSGVTWRDLTGQELLTEEFVTTTPFPVIVEKLRGFIIETGAEIRNVDHDYASLIVTFEDPEDNNRQGSFLVNLEFQESESNDDQPSTRRRGKTYLRISILEGKRKWFACNATELAPNVMRELRNYFVINDDASMLKTTPAATQPIER